MKLYLHVAVLLLFVFSNFNLLAQKKNYVASIETGLYIGTSTHLPLWLKSNNFGVVPSQTPSLFTVFNSRSNHQIFKKDTASGLKRKLLDFNYGFEGTIEVGKNTSFNLIESYVSGRVGGIVLSVGYKKEIFGLVDTLLSSGSVAWSGNALPIPKIQLSTNGFITVPFTNNLLSFQATFSHGWLGSLRMNTLIRKEENNRFNEYNNYVTSYLHQKTFYGCIGKPNWKIKILGGFNHIAQYGNEYIYMPGNYSMLTKFEIYKKVVFGESWAQSKVGNHLGTIDFGMKITLKEFDLFLYRQNYFETGSLLNALNRDGLSGVSIRNKKNKVGKDSYLKRLVIEYLYTNDQVDPLVPTSGSRNDYFNHDLYYDGWTYKGKLIGTPLAVIDRDLKENIDNKDFKGGYIANNRIYAFHIGVDGKYRAIDYLFKLTYSDNQGTYFYPFSSPRKQVSTVLMLKKKILKAVNSEIRVNIGFDAGELYQNNFGLYVGYSKRL